MLMSEGETAGCLGHVERAVKEQLSDNSIIQLTERLRHTERGLATMPLFSPGAGDEVLSHKQPRRGCHILS